MIVILHGENELDKRSYLSSIKKKSDQEEVTINSETADSNEIYKALNTIPLFSQKRLIILENFVLEKSPINLNEIRENIDLILISSKKLTSSQIGKLPKDAKPILFKDTPLIFRFFDNLLPGKTKIALHFFQKIRGGTPNELLMWLLIQHFRRLIIVKEEGLRKLIDLEQIQNWQAEKYSESAKFFSTSDLKKQYHRLFNLEVSYKRGVVDLTETLPIFIFELTKPRSDS